MTRKALFVALVLLVGMAAGQNYLLPWNSINSGGAPVSTSNFVLNGSVAQPVQGIGIGSGYEGYWGFWYGIGRVRRHDAGVTAITTPPDTTYMIAITPAATVGEFADALDDTTQVHFLMFDSVAAEIYHESTTVILDSADVVYPTFPSYTLTVPGNYTALAYTVNPYDATHSNDTTVKPFYVNPMPPETGWVRKADPPLGIKNKKIKDGAALAYMEGNDTLDGMYGFVYAFKGNNRYEFYRYNTASNVWLTKESIPAIGRVGKKKAVKKGSVLTAGWDKLYAAKGNNTVEFWKYDPADSTGYVWKQLADVPTGIKNCREGCGAACVQVGDTDYVYFLKGSNTTEFYRYNTLSNAWESKASAPVGVSGRNFKNGSTVTYDPDRNVIYAVKASYNEFFSYWVDSDRWTTLTSVPLIGSSGRKKKLKDGAGMAYRNDVVYVSKGGNTMEFWKYYADSDKWAQMPDVPMGTGKKVKGGGALTCGTKPAPALYLFKGNNTLDFFRYGFGADLAQASSPKSQAQAQAASASFGLRIGPNPFTTATTIAYSLPNAGNTSLKVYDITGQLVTIVSQGYRAAGSYHARLEAGKLARGIYLVRFATEDRTTTTKLIVE